jgi:hypothetical protein
MVRTLSMGNGRKESEHLPSNFKKLVNDSVNVDVGRLVHGV